MLLQQEVTFSKIRKRIIIILKQLNGQWFRKDIGGE